MYPPLTANGKPHRAHSLFLSVCLSVSLYLSVYLSVSQLSPNTSSAQTPRHSLKSGPSLQGFVQHRHHCHFLDAHVISARQLPPPGETPGQRFRRHTTPNDPSATNRLTALGEQSPLASQPNFPLNSPSLKAVSWLLPRRGAGHVA